MIKRVAKSSFVWIVGLCVLAVGLTCIPRMAQAQTAGANLLVNGGLESPYYAQGSPTATAPNGWALWTGQGQPEAVPNADRPQLREGKTAWMLRSPNVAFTAAGFQRVGGFSAGETVLATGYAWTYACADTVSGCAITDPPYRRSDPAANSTVMIGLDPTGGIDPAAASVIWSAPSQPYDQWQAISVSAAAAGEVVTIFLYMTQETGLAINRVYWDDVSLIRIDAAQSDVTPPAESTEISAAASPTNTITPFAMATAEPSPTPSFTPSPSPTASLTPTSSPTPSPTTPAEPTATPVPVQPVEGQPLPPLIADNSAVERLVANSATLCLNMYQDEDNYGVRDEGETPLPGVMLQIAPLDVRGETQELTYDGQSDPLCLELPGGSYQVNLAPPTGYGLTSPSVTALTLVKGRTLTLSIGSALGYVLPQVPTAAPSQTASPTEGRAAPEVADGDQAGDNERSLLETLYRNSGIIVLGIAGIFVVVSMTALVLVRRGDL